VGNVAESLRTMGPEQLLLALFFLGSYALALGEFAGARGRLFAVATALATAAGFAALSNPWETGVILLAIAPVSVGLFAGAAWTLWVAATWRARHVDRVESAAVEFVPPRAAARPLLSRLRERLRFT
jgi:hypothetical protein